MKLFSSQIGVDAQNLENLIGKNRVQNVRTGFTLFLGGGYLSNRLLDQGLWVHWWHTGYSDYHYFGNFHIFHPDC
jgi:hypothetical protein